MECNKLKSEAREVGRGKHNRPHNSLLGNEYHKNLKEYKTRRKTKRCVFLAKYI